MVLKGCQAEIPAKKLKRGHKKKFLAEFWLIFTKNRQKRGRRKFVYCILKIKFSAAPFLPVFGKISQNSARNFFFVAPFELFGRNFCLVTLQHHFLNCMYIELRREL